MTSSPAADQQTTTATAPAATGAPATHGALYWFWHHTRTRLRTHFVRHRVFFSILLAAVVLFSFLMRAYLHPVVLALRVRIYILTILLPVACALWLLVRSRGWLTRTVVLGGAAAVFMVLLIFHLNPQHYVSLFLRYRSLDTTELKTPSPYGARPDSAAELDPVPGQRGHGRNGDTIAAAPRPGWRFVQLDHRRGAGLSDPAAHGRRQGTPERFQHGPRHPSSQDRRASPVRFDTAENMLLWRNTQVNVVRSFGLFRYLNYEPGVVEYATDDDGNWIQLVPLVRWRGLFFPRPEFGGVQVIRQSGEGGMLATLKHLLLGEGKWIRPADIPKYPWLVGQNLMPVKVSRYIAHSFRFQNGFFAPFPGYHLGDIRIPDLPSDLNDQPFAVFVSSPDGSVPPKLYHYFGLEPFHQEKQGLSTSVFVPADGSPTVYVYPHHKRNEALAGVSAVSAKVMESRKQYDWNRNRPVEHRPYIKDIGGRIRFFWLTTVVTMKDAQGNFIAGSTPEVAITDAAYKAVTWVDPKNPDDWPKQLEKDLAATWKD